MTRKTVLLPVLLGLICGAAFSQLAIASDQAGGVISLLTQMEESYSGITDYEAIFHKQERIGGKLLPEEAIFLRFKKPLSIYMKWIAEPYKGTEALYVQGKYNDKLLIHRGGVLGFLTLSLDPRGTLALKANRHPITEVGLGFLIAGLHRNIQEAVQNGEFEILRIGNEPFMGRATIVVEARFISGNGRKYHASRMLLHIDKDLLLPTGVSFYDERNLLFEKYAYTDVRINVGLTATDFSRANKAYGF